MGLNFEGTTGVDTFVSLAGPQGGVYGPDFFDAVKSPLFENVTTKAAWLVAYNPAGQLISVGELWKDPWDRASCCCCY